MTERGSDGVRDRDRDRDRDRQRERERERERERDRDRERELGGEKGQRKEKKESVCL